MVRWPPFAIQDQQTVDVPLREFCQGLNLQTPVRVRSYRRAVRAVLETMQELQSSLLRRCAKPNPTNLHIIGLPEVSLAVAIIAHPERRLAITFHCHFEM
jgi:hypothetical protein